MDQRNELIARLDELVGAGVAAPWAGRGLRAHADGPVRLYHRQLTLMCLRFFGGLEAWRRVLGDAPGTRPLEGMIVDRYHAEYLALAAEVPKFGTWAVSGEHAATRDAHGCLGELTGRLVGWVQTSAASARTTVTAVNRAVLREPILDLDETAEVTAVQAPTVPGLAASLIARSANRVPPIGGQATSSG